LTPLTPDVVDLALEPWSTPDTPIAETANQQSNQLGVTHKDVQASPTWSEIEADLRAIFTSEQLEEDFRDDLD
ncbi:DUF3580 domain-containing protein, partial [Staphylococcus pseudintermedius]|nr:DUF3580 domain-containing protein [Staphylococcus pseudintermedius]